MKTKLLRKFRKRFIITESKNSMFQYELIDLKKKEVLRYMVGEVPMRTTTHAIYKGCSLILGFFELMNYHIKHLKRTRDQQFRRRLAELEVDNSIV